MPQQHEAKWFSQDSSVVLQASTFRLHVIHAHARESQAQLQRQRHQSRFELCHASIGRCVCVVCGGSALRNLDMPTLEVCLCLFFHCLRIA